MPPAKFGNTIGVPLIHDRPHSLVNGGDLEQRRESESTMSFGIRCGIGLTDAVDVLIHAVVAFALAARLSSQPPCSTC
jgi:hypothetical protein